MFCSFFWKKSWKFVRMPAEKCFCERFSVAGLPLHALGWPPHPTPYIDKCQAVRQRANYPTDFGRIPLDSLLPFSFGAALLRPSWKWISSISLLRTSMWAGHSWPTSPGLFCSSRRVVKNSPGLVSLKSPMIGTEWKRMVWKQEMGNCINASSFASVKVMRNKVMRL